MDLAQLAADLRMAYATSASAGQDLLHPLFADVVMLQHHPETALGDGRRDGPELAALQRREVEMLAAAARDYSQDDVIVAVADDSIDVRLTMRGTLADGTAMEVPVRLVYGFTADRITSMDAHLGGIADDQRSTLETTLGGLATSTQPD
jgi:hypothetical protein